MKQCNVKITDKALADMEAIYNYISEELLNPDAAMCQYNRIADAVASRMYFQNVVGCLIPCRNMILGCGRFWWITIL